jgi:leader peptidase (prepilin peptidase)/N-methyltransferase
MIIIFFIFGLIIGSFLNALIYRLYDGKSIVYGHSQCPKCHHNLSVFDLIPLLSFLLLAGRCRYCGKRISVQYPAVELITGLVFLLLGIKFDFILSEQLLFSLFICSTLIVIGVFDLKHYLILDKVLFFASIVAFFHLVYIAGQQSIFFDLHSSVVQGLIGVIIVSGFFGLQYLISQGKWIGFGDVKFGIFLGLIFGVGKSLMLLLLAYCSGAIVGILLILLNRKQLSSKMPFGTFLAFSGIIMVLAGDSIINWYLGLLGI